MLYKRAILNIMNISAISFLIILAVSITSCTVEKYRIDFLTSADSLELDMSNAIDLAVFDDKLVIADEFKGIWEYRIKDMSFIRKTGEEGRGPGEFFQVMSVTSDDSFVYISDIGNNRISVLNGDGKLVNEISDVQVSDMLRSSSGIYCRDFTGKLLPENKLYSIEDGSLVIKGKVEKFLRENYSFSSYFIKGDYTYILDKKEENLYLNTYSDVAEDKENLLENLYREYDDGSSAHICGYNDIGLWLVVTSYKYGEEQQVRDFRTKVERSRSVIALVSRKGKVLRQFALPEHHVLLDNSEVIKDNLMFFIDIKSEKVYKYSLPLQEHELVNIGD